MVEDGAGGGVGAGTDEEEGAADTRGWGEGPDGVANIRAAGLDECCANIWAAGLDECCANIWAAGLEEC